MFGGKKIESKVTEQEEAVITASPEDNAEQVSEGTQNGSKGKRTTKPPKPFPNYSLEEALKIPQSISKNNAGNPWGSDQIATAVNMSQKSSVFYYFTTASRDYGMTTGTSRGKTIELTALGRKLVYPGNAEEESGALQQAFFNVDIFKKVYEYYKGGALPEERFVCNTLQETFGLDSTHHEEFLQIYSANIEYLKRKSAMTSAPSFLQKAQVNTPAPSVAQQENAPNSTSKLFVIMPFSEKTGKYPEGYFDEVFSSLIVPAASQTGYTAETANKSGSDIIHKTIVSSIYNAELILADLTEHNPNVLFELGLAIAFKKKVAIIRAKGTNPIFDVDHSMRVLDYSPNLWKSTLEMDVIKLAQHLETTALSDESTYLDIFLK